VSDNKFVTADAQFGNATILRPYTGFETAYTGKSCQIPIAWSQDGQPLDPQAGTAGYSARLARGLRVPFGSRVVLWIPTIFAGGLYHWYLIWRLRNLHDFRTNRVPYHLPKQSAGVTSTLVTDPGTRVILAAASQTVSYQQAQPVIGGGSLADVQLFRESIITESRAGQGNALPIMNAAGDLMPISQGVFDPGNPPLLWDSQTSRSPTFQIFETQATGDEMLLMLIRDTSQGTWSFGPGGMDMVLLSFLQSPSLGVYAFVGSAP
jgi:hypothetical protein